MISEKERAQNAAFFYLNVGHAVFVQQFARDLLPREPEGVLRAVSAPIADNDEDLRNECGEDGNAEQNACNDVSDVDSLNLCSKNAIHKSPLYDKIYGCSDNCRDEYDTCDP